jgi:hypothetical protein
VFEGVKNINFRKMKTKLLPRRLQVTKKTLKWADYKTVRLPSPFCVFVTLWQILVPALSGFGIGRLDEMKDYERTFTGQP